MDPVSGKPYDYGVNSYTEYGGAKDFFARLNISLINPTTLKLNTTYIDFATGKPLVGYVPPASADVTAALTRYLNVTSKYEAMLVPSYANFPINVPDELLTKFSDIVVKYDLKAMIPMIYQITGFGLGNIGEELFLYVMQEFSAPTTRVLLGQKNGWVPSTHRNQDLYDNIATLLGPDVLLFTTVSSLNRTNTGVQLLVRSEKGEETLIIAKKLLVSFALTSDNTHTLDLSNAEREVFSTWKVAHGFCRIVTSPSLPLNGSLVNTPAAVVPTNYIAAPTPPFVVRYQYLGDKNFTVLAIGAADYNISLAKSVVTDTFDALAAAGDIPQGSSLNFEAFTEHKTIHTSVPGEEVRDGFYQKLYALQGGRSTFYTGRAWGGQFTTVLWELNNQWMLPKLLASFQRFE